MLAVATAWNLPFLSAQTDSLRMKAVGHLAYPHTTLNDVWGYVDSSGREYALLGTGLGAAIIDLSDPSDPQELFFYPKPYSLWRDVVAYEGFAYVVNEETDGLQIIDLRNLPQTAPARDTVIAGVATAHNLYVDEKGYLYLVGMDQFEGGMMILDLKPNPWQPTFVGAYDRDYVHDVYVRNDTAYAAELRSGLTVIDLSDRSHPTVVGSRTYPGGFTHNTWLSDNSQVCYTTDEKYGGYIIAWDVSDPSNIRERDRARSYLSGGLAAPHNVHVYQDYLVVSHYRDGVWIFDAQRPDKLVPMGFYDTNPEVNQGFDGCWGAYPFLPSGLVLASDVNHGLFVLRPQYQRAAFWEVVVYDDSLGQVLPGVTVERDGLPIGRTDEQGHFLWGVMDSGQVDLQLSRLGYDSRSLPVDLQPGQTQPDTVYLSSRPRANLRLQLLDQNQQPLPFAQVRSEVAIPGDTVAYQWQADFQGRIHVDLVMAGSHRLLAGHWGQRLTLQAVNLPANQTTELNLTLPPGYEDDFTLDLGWQVNSTQPAGSWERGLPLGTAITLDRRYQISPEGDLPDDEGRAAYVTELGGLADPPERHDLDAGFTRLISPEIDLSRFQKPRVRFHFWLSNTRLSSGTLVPDQGKLEVVQVYDGLRFKLLTLDTLLTEAWVPIDSLTLLNFRDLVHLEFVFDAGASAALQEAGLDGFQIFDASTDGQTTHLSAEVDSQPILQAHAPQTGWLRATYAGLFPDRPATLTLYNLQGQAMHQQQLSGSRGQASWAHGLPVGLYVLRLEQPGTAPLVQKVILR